MEREKATECCPWGWQQSAGAGRRGAPVGHGPAAQQAQHGGLVSWKVGDALPAGVAAPIAYWVREGALPPRSASAATGAGAGGCASRPTHSQGGCPLLTPQGRAIDQSSGALLI
jgi:hypothetical protein